MEKSLSYLLVVQILNVEYLGSAAHLRFIGNGGI